MKSGREIVVGNLHIKDLRKGGDRSSLDSWEVLCVPVGVGKRPFRTLVQFNDVSSAVLHAKFVAETKRNLQLDKACIRTVTYSQAKKWGLVAGFSVIESL